MFVPSSYARKPPTEEVLPDRSDGSAGLCWDHDPLSALYDQRAPSSLFSTIGTGIFSHLSIPVGTLPNPAASSPIPPMAQRVPLLAKDVKDPVETGLPRALHHVAPEPNSNAATSGSAVDPMSWIIPLFVARTRSGSIVLSRWSKYIARSIRDENTTVLPSTTAPFVSSPLIPIRASSTILPLMTCPH